MSPETPHQGSLCLFLVIPMGPDASLMRQIGSERETPRMVGPLRGAELSLSSSRFSG